jgi:geranylgeranylglycerol-phosphate geranylgeranyltransferase
MALNLKNLINLIVPHFIITITLGIISSALIINKTIINIPPLILPIISLSLAMFGLNTLNHIVDIDLDRINKPARPLVTGEVKIKEAMAIVLTAFILSILTSILINFLSFLLIILFICLAIIYSVPPIQIRKYLFASNFIGAILYGAMPFIMAWSISGEKFPIIFFLFFTGLIFSIVSTKDFEDVKGEQIKKMKSLPIVLGTTNAAILILSMMTCLLTIILILILIKIINGVYLYPTILSFLILGVYSSVLLKKIKLKEKIMTQAPIVTISMFVVAMIQLIYGITSLYL